MRWIDLNADLGEGGTEDDRLLGLVTSANIACGGHAGDEETMRRTVAHAVAAGVGVGAHPGYEDREHFGRQALVLPLEEVTELVRRQVARLADIAWEEGAKLHHVKPHGALYTQAGRDAALAAAIVAGVAAISPELLLYAQPNSALADAARTAGMPLCPEGFVDRGYRNDGTLMPRDEPGAVIADVEMAVAQAMDLAHGGTVETLCVHSDGPIPLGILQALRPRLEAAGYWIRGKSARDIGFRRC